MLFEWEQLSVDWRSASSLSLTGHWVHLLEFVSFEPRLFLPTDIHILQNRFLVPIERARERVALGIDQAQSPLGLRLLPPDV